MYYVRKVACAVLGVIALVAIIFIDAVWLFCKEVIMWIVIRVERICDKVSNRVIGWIDDIDPDRYKESYSHVE